MSTIFISHSSEDNAWAERIRDWLQGMMSAPAAPCGWDPAAPIRPN